MAFAKLKALLRKAAAPTFDELWKAIGQICDLFAPQECANYFKGARYGFESFAEIGFFAGSGEILRVWPGSEQSARSGAAPSAASGRGSGLLYARAGSPAGC
jgi:hypothetical protein